MFNQGMLGIHGGVTVIGSSRGPFSIYLLLVRAAKKVGDLSPLAEVALEQTGKRVPAQENVANRRFKYDTICITD